MKRKIYLDYAATTPVSEEVLAAMRPYFGQKFGNPSEIHNWGTEAKKAVEEAREKVAKVLGANAKEIIFTSCATESINLAHKGLVENLKFKIENLKLLHIITSSVEHKAVIETCKHLEKAGLAVVTYLPVNHEGLVSLEDLEKAIRPETVLVSVMYVNNEVGTIEPIEEIGKLIKKINQLRITNNPASPARLAKRAGRQLPIYFHTDATQAIQYLDCDVNRVGADFLSLTGHKFYAPKGIGALYVRKRTPFVRQQDGGGQERGLRAGTENVPYIVGLGKAIENCKSQIVNSKLKTEKLRDRLIEGILKILGTKLTGPRKNRVPHMASFIIEGVEGEALLLLLNEYGIAASTGSACTTGDLSPSHVLTAMGYKPEESHGSLRLSLGSQTTKEDIDYVLGVLPGIVEKLRKMAPKF